MTITLGSRKLILAAFSILLIGLTATNLRAESHVATPPPVVAPPPINAVTPPALPATPSLAIFVAQNGQPTGPFGQTALAGLVAAGALLPTSMVWQDGMVDWATASTIAALAPILATAPAQPAFDAQAYVVGSWEADQGTILIEGIGTGITNQRTVYNANGSVSTYGTIQAQSTYGVMTQIISGEGTYTVTAFDATSFTVTPNMQMTMSMQGVPPKVEPFTTPIRNTVIDQNTMIDGSGLRWHRR